MQGKAVTEEEHTSGLLFPDASLLRRSNTHAFPLQTTFNPEVCSSSVTDSRGVPLLRPEYAAGFRVDAAVLKSRPMMILASSN
jgi:hypothetical protein